MFFKNAVLSVLCMFLNVTNLLKYIISRLHSIWPMCVKQITLASVDEEFVSSHSSSVLSHKGALSFVSSTPKGKHLESIINP